MKRPIFTCALGFVFGILVGLYNSVAPFIFIVVLMLEILLRINKLNNKIFKIINVFIKNGTIFLFCLSACLSSIYLNIINQKYENIYKTFKNGNVIATVFSDSKESEYKSIYKIKLESFNNKKYRSLFFLLEIPKGYSIEYGDKIEFYGEYIAPDGSKNYKGFDYAKYLKSEGIYGKFKTNNNVKIIKEKNINIIEDLSNRLKHKIITNSPKFLPKKTAGLMLGMIIGYKTEIENNIQDDFRKSGLSHLLAVSGAHIAYIIIGLESFLKFIKVPQKVRKICIVLFLIFFMYIVGFTPSIMRASIMAICLLIATLIYRKQDSKTTISISILIILIKNPYSIINIGLILSYLATIGIIIYSNIKKTSKTNKIQSRWYNFIKDIICVSLFANIFVIPIILYNYKNLCMNFIISNFIASVIIAPITIGGIVLIIISFMSVKLAYIISYLYNPILNFLLFTINFISKLPLSEIWIITPSKFLIVIYYICIFSSIKIFLLKKEYSNRYLVKKIIKFKEIIAIFLKVQFKKLAICSILIISIFFILKLIPNKLKIYFIDVGQGESSLIITPRGKKILIDSGRRRAGKFRRRKKYIDALFTK